MATHNLEADVGSYDPSSGTFDQNHVYLVTRSGEYFRVGRTPAGTGPLNLSLSPDGRWLGAKRDGRWRVRDLSGVAEYEVPDEYELWLWSTDARSLLLAKPGVDGRAFSAMALPGGGVRSLGVRTPKLATEVAFIAGTELAVFDPNPLLGLPAASQELSITLTDVVTGASRKLPVVVPGQLRPGEVAGPIIALWHAGGSPPSIWVEVGRPDLLPTGMPEGVLVAPSVALLGVDVASDAATARIDVLYGNFKHRPPLPALRPVTTAAEAIFDALDPGIWGADYVRTCSVCDQRIGQELHQVWISHRVGTDVLPFLVNACSPACIDALPQPAHDHVQTAHTGGPGIAAARLSRVLATAAGCTRQRVAQHLIRH